MNNKYYIYYHIFLAENWYEIMNEQLNSLLESGLLSQSILRIGALFEMHNQGEITKFNELISGYKNIEVLFIDVNVNVGESATLDKLKSFCDESLDNFKILYLHGKGVSQYNSPRQNPVRQWRKMMEYYLVDRWQECISKLDEGYDCCGINYQFHAGNIKGSVQGIYIFNGNFWWTNSNYIKTLDRSILFEHRYSAENWILSSPHKAFSPFNCPNTVNLYYDECESFKKI